MYGALRKARTFLAAVLMAGSIALTSVAVMAAEEPVQAPSGETAAPADSTTEADRGVGNGRHRGRQACHEDVKKFCGDIKPGQGRIIQCLKQHAQELSPACADQMQHRAKRP